MAINPSQNDLPKSFIDFTQSQSDFYLTPQAISKILVNANAVNSLVLEDIKPEFQDIWATEEEKKLIKDMLNEAIGKVFVQLGSRVCFYERHNFLKLTENAPFFNDLGMQITRIVVIAMENFRRGAVPYSEVINVTLQNVNYNYSLLGSLQKKESTNVVQQVKPHKFMLKAIDNQQASLQLQEEKKGARRENAFQKEMQKKQHIIVESNAQLLNEIKNNFDYYLFLSSKLDKDLDQILPEEIRSKENLASFEKFKEKKRTQLEKKALLEIEKEFEPTEQKKEVVHKPKAKKKSHSSKQTKVATKAQESLVVQKKVEQLVTVTPQFILLGKTEFFLDKRISRWFQVGLEGIRDFVDKVASVKVRHYKDLDPSQLEEQRLYHRLPGIERLLSLAPEKLRKYSRPYQFIQHDGSVKRGRCFSVQLKHGSTLEKGMIYVGVDGKKIYHAQFVSFFKTSSPAISGGIRTADMCLHLDGFDSQSDLLDDWEMQGGYNFKVEEDESIIWTIADGSNEVEFQIQSLF